jgi:DNA-binding transcriptional LysR family regulator
MPIFVGRYPDVAIDVSVTNRMVDVIGGGFDAGIRYGGTVPEDMIAQRLSPELRWMAAAIRPNPPRSRTQATSGRAHTMWRRCRTRSSSFARSLRLQQLVVPSACH